MQCRRSGARQRRAVRAGSGLSVDLSVNCETIRRRTLATSFASRQKIISPHECYLTEEMQNIIDRLEDDDYD